MKKIFISHCMKDESKAKSLKKALDKYPDHFEPILIIDKKTPGVYFPDKISGDIDSCDLLCPIITKNSITNQWVNQEIGYAFAKGKEVIPILAKTMTKKLNGFLNQQMDCPFRFEPSTINQKEYHSYRKTYLNFIDHLLHLSSEISAKSKESTLNIFSAHINPTSINRGSTYTTYVSFQGNVLHGFFDNYIEHMQSSFRTWNWDPATLPIAGNTNPGTLHGDVNVNTQYTHSTKNWPLGNYRIYVRLYEHNKPGVLGRKIMAQEIINVIVK